MASPGIHAPSYQPHLFTLLPALETVEETIASEIELEINHDQDSHARICENIRKLYLQITDLLLKGLARLQTVMDEARCDSKTETNQENAIEKLREFEESLRRTIASTQSKNHNDKSLSDIIHEYEQQLHNSNIMMCCPLSRDMRCAIVIQIVNGSIKQSEFEKVLSLLGKPLKYEPSDTRGEQYVNNIQIRREYLVRLYETMFDKQVPEAEATPKFTMIASELAELSSQSIKEADDLNEGLIISGTTIRDMSVKLDNLCNTILSDEGDFKDS